MVSVLYVGSEFGEVKNAVRKYDETAGFYGVPPKFSSKPNALRSHLEQESIEVDAVIVNFSWKEMIPTVRELYPDIPIILLHGNYKYVTGIDAHASFESDLPGKLEELLSKS